MTTNTLKSMTKRRRKSQRGMTLVEIMVVITILGLIAAAVGVAVVPRLNEAKQDRARLDMKNMEGALKLYYTKKGNYPDTGTGLKGLVDQQLLDQMPQDPWNRDYVYMNEGGKPVIISYGADGAPGGEGPDSDISSKDSGKPQK